MKAKRIALIALAAAALTGGANAQQVIRITGSTAFRGAANTAIGNILNPGYTYGYTGSAFSSSNRTIFTGTTKPPTNTAVIIKCQWSGAVGGVKTIVQNVALPEWLVNASPQSSGAGTQIVAPAYDPAVTCDIAMHDGFQNTTEFKTPVMTARVVGALPFQWFRNNGSPRTIDNINPVLASNLLSGGIFLSQFTGNPLDTDIVYGTGRDEDSGTRMVTFADCLFGVFSSPTQWQPQISGGTITDLIPWPPATVLGTNYSEGHSGYPGGGQLVTAMNTPGSNTTSANPGWLVSYAGINDAQSALAGVAATATATVGSLPVAGPVTAINVTNGGTNYGLNTFVTISGGGGSGATAVPVLSSTGVVTSITITSPGSGYTAAPTVAIRGGAALKYNGFNYTADSVRNGQYSFWSYMHVLTRPGYANIAIYDQLADRIKTVDAAVSGILLSTMNVGRAVEGGPVTPGNPYP